MKSDFSGWFDNSEKGDLPGLFYWMWGVIMCLGILSGCGVIPWLHSASGMLQTTAYLLLDHMAPN
jgi:hypothetical protein